MKRLHVHVSVRNLETSIRFYAELFAAEPSVRKPDYAKWMLEDPRVNFAISRRESQRGTHPGVQHLGIQVEDRPELEEVYARLKRAEGPLLDECASCCPMFQYMPRKFVRAIANASAFARAIASERNVTSSAMS